MPNSRLLVNLVGPVVMSVPLAIVAAGPGLADDPAAPTNGSVVTLPAPAGAADEGQLGTQPVPDAGGEAGSGADLSAPNPDWVFSAERKAGGPITLGGMVPNPDVEHELAALAGADAGDETKIAEGAPEGFVDAAHAGLAALAALDAGKLSFADGHWSLTGQAATEEAAQKAREQLAATVDVSDWTIEISTPQPAQASGGAGAENKAAEAPEQAEPAAPAAPAEAATPAPAAPPASPEAAAEPAPGPEPEASEAAVPPPQSPGSKPAPEEPAAAAPEPAKPAAAEQAAEAQKPAGPYQFSATRGADGSVALTGSVPPSAARRYFGLVAGNAPVDALSVAPGAPEGFTADATGGLHALAQLESGSLSYDGQRWSIKGKAATRAALEAAKAEIAALPDASSWSLDIAGPSPLELCQQDIAEIEKANAITFAAGSARITPGSADEIDAVAKILAGCPSAKVEVEGHTDSDGDAKVNLALSVARAEAVVAALADKGINSDRLYAVGYGESRPLVPNDTPADKARNRRIGFTIKPE